VPQKQRLLHSHHHGVGVGGIGGSGDLVERSVNVCGTVGIAVAVGSGVSVTLINGSGLFVGPAGDGVSVTGGTGVAVCVDVGNGVMVLVARSVSVIGIDVAIGTEVGDETTRWLLLQKL